MKRKLRKSLSWLLTVAMIFSLFCGMIPTASAAENVQAKATDGTEEVVANITHDSGDTALTINIWLNKEKVATTGEFRTAQVSNHVEVIPVDSSWKKVDQDLHDNGTWGPLGTLTLYEKENNVLDVYYSTEVVGDVYTLLENDVLSITVAQTSLSIEHSGTIEIYIDNKLKEKKSVELHSNGARQITLDFDHSMYSFEAFEGGVYHYFTENDLRIATIYPGDNFTWKIYLSTEVEGTQIVDGHLGDIPEDTFSIQETHSTGDVLDGGEVTVKVYLSDVLMYTTKTTVGDGQNYYRLNFDTEHYVLDKFEVTDGDNVSRVTYETLATLHATPFHIPGSSTIEIWLVPVESFAFDIEREAYQRVGNVGISDTNIADSVVISWSYNGHNLTYNWSGDDWARFTLRLPKQTDITVQPNMNTNRGWICWGWTAPETVGTTATLLDSNGNPATDTVVAGVIGLLNKGGDGTVKLRVASGAVESTSVMLRLYGIDYNVAKFEKELVTTTPGNLSIPEGITISYPEDNGTVKVSADDASVTLLYKLTVVSKPNTSFTVTDESAKLITQDGFTQNEDDISGKIPSDGVAQFYVYKEFSVTDETTSVANQANIKVNDDVGEDEDIAPGEETDTEETIIDKDDSQGGDKPDAPDESTIPEILGEEDAILVNCVSEDVNHALYPQKTYNLWADGSDDKNRYDVSEVTYDSKNKIWTCDVTILPGVYVEQYNADTATTHWLAPAGQTGVTVTLTAEYNEEAGTWTWTAPKKGTQYWAKFDVACVPEKPADADIPGILGADEAILVKCGNTENTHYLDEKTYDLWENNHNNDGIIRYTVGTPSPSVDGSWTCDVTLNPETYWKQYIQDTGSIPHVPTNPGQEYKVVLTWNAQDQKWVAEDLPKDSPYRAIIEVTCEEKQVPTIPDEIEYEDLKALINVEVVCDTSSSHAAKPYELIKGSYTCDVDQTSGKATVTVDSNEYVARFNDPTTGAAPGHSTVGTKQIILTWDFDKRQWITKNYTVFFHVTCTDKVEEDPSTEYAKLKEALDVTVECVKGIHADKTYELAGDGLIAGKIQGTGTADDPYLCKVTIDSAPYVTLYNNPYTGTADGHEIAEGTYTQVTVTLVWDNETNQWKLGAGETMPVFKVECEAEEPTPEPGDITPAVIEDLLKYDVVCTTNSEHNESGLSLGSGTYISEVNKDNNTCEVKISNIKAYIPDGHELDQAETQYDSITLLWNGSKWTVNGTNDTFKFYVKCQEEQPPVVEDTYIIDAASGPNGTVEPSGESKVKKGGSLTISITPNQGYAVDTITVDSVDYVNNGDGMLEVWDKFTFASVDANHTLYVSFAEDQNGNGIPDKYEEEDPNPPQPGKDEYIIYAYAGRHGDIEPSGTVTVQAGENEIFYFDPDNGYEVDYLVVDGKHLSARDSYTFYDVDEDHTIYVYFTSADKEEDEEDDDRDDASDPTYAVYYYPGYGSGARDLDKRYEEDMEVEVLAFEDVDLTDREGYTFIGWSTQPNAGSVTYLSGDTFDMPDHDVYLYAQWLRDQIGPEDTGVANWLNTTDHIAYLTGYPNGAFGPNNSMTRAEVAQMFYALLNNKNVTITATFPDVPADAWYATAVNTLASLGMVSGDADGNFRPNDPITRAEFCVIALAFAYEPESYSCSFTDVSVNDWFYTYVAQAASYGWIGGYADGSFGPNDLITRAQVTTIVNNMLGREADRSYVNNHADTLVQFNDLTSIHWAYYDIMEAVNEHEYTKTYGVEDWVE